MEKLETMKYTNAYGDVYEVFEMFDSLDAGFFHTYALNGEDVELDDLSDGFLDSDRATFDRLRETLVIM